MGERDAAATGYPALVLIAVCDEAASPAQYWLYDSAKGQLISQLDHRCMSAMTHTAPTRQSLAALGSEDPPGAWFADQTVAYVTSCGKDNVYTCEWVYTASDGTLASGRAADKNNFYATIWCNACDTQIWDEGVPRPMVVGREVGGPCAKFSFDRVVRGRER